MNSLQAQAVSFAIMWALGVFFNPMNALASSARHLYLSTTLCYGGLLMSFNMMWAHQIIHQLLGMQADLRWLLLGFAGSAASVGLLRSQRGVTPEQWVRRMVPHHSTAITTSSALLKRYSQQSDQYTEVLDFARELEHVQAQEISIMEGFLQTWRSA